jgi:glycosyltransferase involved in cell wall biosynthesis
VRIAFVLAGLGAGGAERVVNLLAHHRDERNDTVHVIAVNAADPQSYFPYRSSIKVEVLGQRPWASRIAVTVYRLVELRGRLRAIQPDLVVSFLTKVNTLVGLATLGLGTAAIMSERNNYRLQGMSPFWRLSAPIAARGAARLVMQTDMARSLLPEGLKERAVVIPNPVTLPDDFRRSAGNGMRFVAVGRLERQKGFDLLLQAFSRVAREVPEATLVIFGEGPERASLELQARKLKLADRIRMPGVSHSPGSWLSAGDVFVLSSRFEGFPNVLLEALMAGMPTVAFDCPWGPAEILCNGEAGLLVPAGDVEQLGKMLRRVATDQSLRQRLAAAGPAAATRYSKPVVCAQWDEVISNAVEGRPINLPAQP